MNWTSRIFLYVIIAFAVFVLASGDGTKWKKLFTGSIQS